MKRQFFDYFRPLQFIEKHRRSQAMELGLKLSSGMPLPSALQSIAKDAVDRRESKALIDAAEKLRNGMQPQEVLKNSAIRLNPRDRYVLSLSLDDVQKGNILKSWLINSKLRERHKASYETIAATLMIIGLVSVALLVFVIPQFHEIVLCVKLTTDSFVGKLEKYFYYLSDSQLYALFPFLLNGLCGFLIFLGKVFFNSRVMDEEADMISMIAASDYENQWKNFEMVSSRICFPCCFRKFSKIIEAQKNGVSLEESIDKARLSPMLTWLLLLSIHNQKDRAFLNEGADMMKQQADFENNHRVRIFEILAVVVESSIIMLFVYHIFGMLEVIQIGAMS